MLKAIIIDDELSARETLEELLGQMNGSVQLLASCKSAVEGVQRIAQFQPDLIFLDVEMPQMSGFDLLNVLGENIKSQIIFVTGFDKYALQAIQFSAIDYLMKPVNPQLLKSAVEKAATRVAEHQLSQQYKTFLHNIKETNLNLRTLALPTAEGLQFVRICDIVRCDANGNYTTVCMVNKQTVLVSRTLKEFEKLLSGMLFMRVHNSHIINLNHIRKYFRGEGGYVIMADDSMIEISRSRKEEFLNTFLKI